MKWIKTLCIAGVIISVSCGTRNETLVKKEIASETTKIKPTISKEVYHDKVLGLLIGSAIGDAMGAPTEMWPREEILLDYGFVNGLDSMVRNPSGEGTWKYNLPAGGTTDDTRWKKLSVEYIVQNGFQAIASKSFAQHIISQYQDQIVTLKETDGFDPGPYEENLMKMAWLQEWALVASPFIKEDFHGYNIALHKFYGGEMSCAGMLYSPVFGAVTPADPLKAYNMGYDMSIFDIGYARDMTALVSAMTSEAFDENATPKSILNINRSIDPQGFFKSRLVGRSAYRFYQYARRIKFETDALTLVEYEVMPTVPKSFQQLEILEYLQLMHAYDLLDEVNEDVAFHPGEIYLITLTAMIFCDFDFKKSMEFIVNYGRDNDTVAAIAGAILGAYWGANQLPKDMTNQVLDVNINELDIDLEALATQLTEKYFE